MLSLPVRGRRAVHFKLVYGNHYNFGLSPSHTLLMLKYGLEGLGHRADIEKDFQPSYTNILVENFTEEYVTAVEQAWTPATRLIVIGTEIVTGGTFNEFSAVPNAGTPDQRLDHYRNQDYLKPRFQSFLKLSPRMNAVWHLAHQQVDAFQNLLPGVSVGYVAHGYASAIASVVHRQESAKDIDVFFSGARTRYRDAIMENLAAAGFKLGITHQMTAPFHRDDLVARSKLAINIRQDKDWPYESNSRLYYHIVNDSIVLTEACPAASDLHDYAPEIAGDVADFVAGQLAMGDFTERAIAVRERLARERPMSGVLRPLLKQIGID